jgi:hypothetical protein
MQHGGTGNWREHLWRLLHTRERSERVSPVRAERGAAFFLNVFYGERFPQRARRAREETRAVKKLYLNRNVSRFFGANVRMLNS